jgi:FkbM family methyltransferase
MNFWDMVYGAATRLQPVAPRTAGRMMLAAHGRTVEAEIRLLPGLADRARISVDIGANWGLYAGSLLPLSREVIAFEPNPAMAEELRRAFPAVRLEACALGAEPGAACLRIPIAANGKPAPGWATLSDRSFERTRDVEVPVRRLDDYELRGVGFVKIDVEGFEMQVLDGAWQTLARERPNLLIECGDDGPAALAGRLAQLGYCASFWLDGTLHPVDAWRPDMVAWHGGPPNNVIFRQGSGTPTHSG